MVKSDELLLKISHDLKMLKDDIDEIKYALIPEDELEEGELDDIRAGEREVNAGGYRSWDQVKKEI